MLFQSTDRIFDTLIDTQKKRVSMIKVKFTIRKDILVSGEHPIYINITGGGHKRERIHTQIYVAEKFWNKDLEKITGKDENSISKQMILNSYKSKINSIEIEYKLTHVTLTPELLKNEYENKLSRINFVGFFLEALEDEKSNLTHGSYKRYHSVYLKLKEYNSFIPFNTITLAWFKKYKNYLKEEKGNLDTTISSNIAAIKKFMKIAETYGIKLLFDLDHVTVGSTRGNRTYLNGEELKKCFDFYFSPFITQNNRIILGYFLFSCMNGLRISNVQGITRKELLSSDFSIVMVKGNKDKILSMNQSAKKIIMHEPELFVTKFEDQTINVEIKKIMLNLGITKKVSFHVARHTFATLFLKAGGKIQNLKELLGHSTIETTMIYSHIVLADANEEIYLMDKYCV